MSQDTLLIAMVASFNRMAFILGVICGLFVLGVATTAQEDPTPSPTAEPLPDNLIVYGQVVTGQINNNAPLATYTFDARRCDFLAVQVRATSGNLDPVLTVLDNTGAAIFTRDDSEGNTDVRFEPLSIPRNGRYSIVVGRFGYSLGTTSGGYELFIERIGNGSANFCAMRYGDAVTNSIDGTQPELWYSFSATRGDIVNVSMRATSPGLDGILTVTDAGGFMLYTSDDQPDGSINPLINGLLIPQDGDYFIRVGRYGDTSGNFILSLDEAANSGIGNSQLAAIPIRPNSTVEGTITNQISARYYRLEARQNDVISLRMERTSSNLDTFLAITDADGNELITNDDIEPGFQNSRIDNFLIPANGTYFIIATRYEREDGLTTGEYRLILDSDGNPFEDISGDVLRIAYGSTVTGNIDDVTPEIRYVFWGTAGETVTISMLRTGGDLDPLLRLLGTSGATIATDDDSGSNNNAEIAAYTLANSGIHTIVATRFLGQSVNSGAYALTITAEPPPTPEP